MKNLKPFIPTAPEVSREIIIVLVGVIGAAFILSRFPNLKKFVTENSVTLNDQNGNNIV